MTNYIDNRQLCLVVFLFGPFLFLLDGNQPTRTVSFAIKSFQTKFSYLNS